MAISLSKGEKVSLTKGNPGLNNIRVGLGWDINRYDGGSEFDLDVSVFLLGEDGKITETDDFVFYGNLKHNSGSVEHTGDNRTGDGDGDDEVIKVKLSSIPEKIKKVVFTATIYEAIARRQNFGQVENAYIRIVDEEKNTELIRFDLGEDFSVENALVVGELYRHNSEWKFNAIGSGYENNLEGLCGSYGVNI